MKDYPDGVTSYTQLVVDDAFGRFEETHEALSSDLKRWKAKLVELLVNNDQTLARVGDDIRQARRDRDKEALAEAEVKRRGALGFKKRILARRGHVALLIEKAGQAENAAARRQHYRKMCLWLMEAMGDDLPRPGVVPEELRETYLFLLDLAAEGAE